MGQTGWSHLPGMVVTTLQGPLTEGHEDMNLSPNLRCHASAKLCENGMSHHNQLEPILSYSIPSHPISSYPLRRNLHVRATTAHTSTQYGTESDTRLALTLTLVLGLLLDWIRPPAHGRFSLSCTCPSVWVVRGTPNRYP